MDGHMYATLMEAYAAAGSLEGISMLLSNLSLSLRRADIADRVLAAFLRGSKGTKEDLDQLVALLIENRLSLTKYVCFTTGTVSERAL